MRRSDFISLWDSGDMSFYDVVQLMKENDYEDAYNVVEGDEYDSAVESDIAEFLRHEYWYNLSLGDLPGSGDGWYYRYDLLEYGYLSDDDQSDMVDRFVEWMDDGDGWDEEEEEEEEELIPESEEDAGTPDAPAEPPKAEFEDEEMVALLTVCQSDLQVISDEVVRDRETRQKEDEARLVSLANGLSAPDEEDLLPF